MIGRTISHYRILEKLGEGGMGVVYKAQDLKLDRFVAIKVLAPHLSRDKEAIARFIHEAKAASALDHSHIGTIHDIDETSDGQAFIAMAYYEGETLHDRIKRGNVTIEEALTFASQIAAGLAKAHEKGIVHRDIKPSNIIITKDGQAKIMDFGLAKLAGGTKLTRTGSSLGTVAYMSPEQAQGREVDERSDIFSLGTVLYELIAGRLPFKGEHEAAVLYEIVHEKPEPLSSRRKDISDDLEQIVARALQKDMSARYQKALEMKSDIDETTRTMAGMGSGARMRARPPGAGARTRLWASLVVIAVVIAVGTVTLMRLRSARESSAVLTRERPGADDRKMIAVLPFENLGDPEDDYFVNGTTDAITARLASVSGLGVISRQSAIQYKKSTKPVRQIGEELGVDYILDGTVQRERPGDPKSRIRVIPRLIRVADDTHMWADTYDENMTEVFRVQSDIAEKVAMQLNVTLLEPERRAIKAKPTENPAAYEEYLRGMDYFYAMGSVADAERAARLFQKAVSLDSRFAEAWAMLSSSRALLYWLFDQTEERALAEEAAGRAAQLAPDIPEIQIALGRVHYVKREFNEALKHYEAAQRLQPSGDAAFGMGTTLRRMGKWQEALEQFEAARQLIPRSYFVAWDALAYTNACMHRFDEAEQYFDQAVALAPHQTVAYIGKAFVLLARNGDVDAARRVMSEMSRRANIAEEAERVSTGGWLLFFSDLRIHPEMYRRAFEAFESGPMNRYRKTQPAVVANTHLYQAVLIEAAEDRRSASARYDSARVQYERIIRLHPQSAGISRYHILLGLAYAGLNRKEDAIREGERAARMSLAYKDALDTYETGTLLAEIYIRCGEDEKAIDQLETVLSTPGYITATLLRIDPIWEPIRANPRFRRLLEEN